MRELIPVLFVGLVPIAVLTLIVTGTAFSLVAWQPPILQTSQFGTANSASGITAITSDSSGIYTGGFVGLENVAPSYLFVTKYDLSLNMVWTERFGNATEFSRVAGIGVGTDGVYVVGHLNRFANSSFVRKYDLDGNQVWNNSMFATAVSVSSGGVYLVGVNGTSQFLWKYDSSGGLVWSRIISNGTGEAGVYAGPNGAYVDVLMTANSSIMKYNSDGTLFWTRSCACGPGITGDSTGLYLTGFAVGFHDGTLTKFDLDGSLLWTRQFGIPGYSTINHLEIAADSPEIYIASTTTDYRGIVMKYDTNGGEVWSVQLPWAPYVFDTYNVLSAQKSRVYVGGTLYLGKASDTFPAIVTVMSDSSSLVFFGLNPPLSFVSLATLVGLVAITLVWLRRLMKKRPRHPSTRQLYRPRNTPAPSPCR